jgi:hypothetical protein
MGNMKWWGFFAGVLILLLGKSGWAVENERKTVSVLTLEDYPPYLDAKRQDGCFPSVGQLFVEQVDRLLVQAGLVMVQFVHGKLIEPLVFFLQGCPGF